MEKFDDIIIGAGPAGTAAASSLKAAGRKVLIVENNLFGGTCPNFGCDPKKILYSAVAAKDAVSRLGGFGLTGEPKINWQDLMGFKRSYTKTVPIGTENGLKNSGVKTLHGTAHFLDTDTLAVDSARFTADNYIIATGQKPAIIDIPGKEYFNTSTTFLDLSELPSEVIFVGGGFVSFELANIAASAGAKVHLIHHNAQPLKKFDQELVGQLIELMRKRGIDVQLNASPTALLAEHDRYRLKLREGDDITADAVFAGTGRVANIEELNLNKANIEFNAHGVHVNEYLQTTNAKVYAIGDVTDLVQPKLTPVAGFMSRYLVKRLLGKNDEPFNLPVTPEITFGTTELAQVGVTTTTARKNQRDFTISDFDVTGWYSYNRTKEEQAMVKVVIDNRSQLLVGAAVLSSSAEELINHFMWLIDQKITKSELQQKIFAYPSIASDLGYFY